MTNNEFRRCLQTEINRVAGDMARIEYKLAPEDPEFNLEWVGLVMLEAFLVDHNLCLY